MLALVCVDPFSLSRFPCLQACKWQSPCLVALAIGQRAHYDQKQQENRDHFPKQEIIKQQQQQQQQNALFYRVSFACVRAGVRPARKRCVSRRMPLGRAVLHAADGLALQRYENKRKEREKKKSTFVSSPLLLFSFSFP